MSADILEAKNRFETWRREHGGRLRGLPAELQALAILLLVEHGRSEVKEQLRVSNSSLYRWQQSEEVQRIVQGMRESSGDEIAVRMPTEPLGADAGGAFVELAAPVLGARDAAPISIRLEMPSGAHLCIDGPLDQRLVQMVVRTVCHAPTRSA